MLNNCTWALQQNLLLIDNVLAKIHMANWLYHCHPPGKGLFKSVCCLEFQCKCEEQGEGEDENKGKGGRDRQKEEKKKAVTHFHFIYKSRWYPLSPKENKKVTNFYLCFSYGKCHTFKLFASPIIYPRGRKYLNLFLRCHSHYTFDQVYL